jgi:hypothetical protein
MGVLERALRLAATALSLLVVGGWALFAIDETRSASESSAAETAGQRATRQADPTPEEERDRERAHGTVRELIDDANDILLTPFATFTEGSRSQWVRRTVPALLALLVYGFGLGLLARYRRGRW